MAGRARRAGDRQCVDPKPVDLRQPRRPRLWRGTVSRRLRRAGCQRHRDAQHPWAEQCPSGADHDIDPRQRGWADWVPRQRWHGLLRPRPSLPDQHQRLTVRCRHDHGANGASIPCSPSGRKGRATPPPSPATSAGPSTTTSKAARWRPALPPARKAKPSEADASIAHAESYGTAPVAEAEPAGCSRLKTETRSTDLSAGLASSSDAAPDVRSDKEGSG